MDVLRSDLCDLFAETFPVFVFLCAGIFSLPGLPNQFTILSYLLWFEVILYTVLESFSLGF